MVVKCTCGETEITLRNPTPRLKCECMCYDCCQRWDWQKSQGCKLGDYYESWSKLETRAEICELYVDNAVVSVKGEENLKTWQLKEGSKMRMLICDKCKFVMINSHELYNGNIVMVSAKHTDCDVVPITIRGFAKEWPCPAREGPIPGPDRPVPELEGPHTNIIGPYGMCNIMKVYWKASLVKTYNNLPYREPGDKDIRDFMEKEPSVAGLTANVPVTMDH
jgi:hypothetical protein